MPKHIFRLLGLLAVFALLFVGGRIVFTPQSFGIYGHYRAASVEEIAAMKPRIADAASYSAVYPREYATWSANIHSVIQCQDCHMATTPRPNDMRRFSFLDNAGQRVADLAQDVSSLAETWIDGSASADAPHAGPPPSPDGQQPAELRAVVDHSPMTAFPIPHDSLKLCVECHQKIAGRRGSMPQINVADHTQGRQCTSCHNPHSPLFSPTGAPIALAAQANGPVADIAAGKTAAAACAACHGPAGVSVAANFPNLACQRQPYLVATLTAFQNGTRTNPIMTGIAQSLSKTDVVNLAGYFASQSCGQRG